MKNSVLILLIATIVANPLDASSDKKMAPSAVGGFIKEMATGTSPVKYECTGCSSFSVDQRMNDGSMVSASMKGDGSFTLPRISTPTPMGALIGIGIGTVYAVGTYLFEWKPVIQNTTIAAAATASAAKQHTSNVERQIKLKEDELKLAEDRLRLAERRRAEEIAAHSAVNTLSLQEKHMLAASEEASGSNKFFFRKLYHDELARVQQTAGIIPVQQSPTPGNIVSDNNNHK